MNEFQAHKIGELLKNEFITEIQDGNHGEIHPTSADYVKDGVPFVMASDLSDNRLDIENCKFITEQKAKNLRKGFAKPGDVLLTHKGSLGLTDVVQKIKTPFLMLTPQVTYYRPNPKHINQHFLKYIFLSKDFQNQLFLHSRGGTRPYIGITAQRELSIKIPSLDLQNKISNILQTYDNLIATNQRRIALLEEAARRIYREWFVHLRFPGHESVPLKNGIPEGWIEHSLRDICDIGYGYPFKSSLFNSIEKGTPAVRIRDIPNINTSTYTTEEADKSYMINRGDFLIGMDGIFHMNHWIGKSAYLVQRVCRIRPKQESLLAYIGLALSKPIKDLEATIQGSTVAHLGAKHLNAIKILTPTDMDEQLRFLNDLLWQKISLQENNLVIAKARDLLLPKLMSGQLDVSRIPAPEEALA